MKNNNLVWAKMPNGGQSPFIALEGDVMKKIGHMIASDEREFCDNPKRCVIPEYDSVQSVPIVRSFSDGYDTPLGCVLSYVTGWHLIWRHLKRHFRPLYYANTEGMRLIAKHGDPHKAFASL